MRGRVESEMDASMRWMDSLGPDMAVAVPALQLCRPGTTDAKSQGVPWQSWLLGAALGEGQGRGWLWPWARRWLRARPPLLLAWAQRG